jgi:pyridoxine 5'-phosphate synthase PdxJ
VRRLSVGLDAFAALREAATRADPVLTAAAALAEVAGADAVRVGLRSVLRPVGERDVHDLRRAARNLEIRMSADPALLKLALHARPDRVVLAGEPAPERPGPAPLEPAEAREALGPALRTLRDAGIEGVACIVPELDAVKAAHAAGVAGVELFTGRIVDLPAPERRHALESLADAARLAAKLRLPVSLGGGLDRRSLPLVLEAVPVAERVAVGRSLAVRAALVGLDRAVCDFLSGLG